MATILLAKKYGEPLDEAVYCEVMFDKDISGEVPEHREFIYGKAIPALESMGVPVRVLHLKKTYVDLFTGRISRGPKKGMLRSFPICGRCAVQRDCKLKPILAYQKSLPLLGTQPKPSEADSVGKGGARKRTQFSPQAETQESLFRQAA